MRKIYIIITLFAVVISTLACDILDQYPHNAVSRDSVSEADLELLCTGLYCYSQYKPSFEGYFQNDMAGGDFYRGGGTVFPDAPTWIRDCMLANSGWTGVAYNGYYAWLYQVNSFIAMAESADQTTKVKQMMGVAYYFRALIYYNLTTKYREVPILDKPTNEAIAKSSEQDCWNFVNADLDKALELCPVYSTKNYVSIQAAKALAARAYIAQGRKAEAAQLAEELIADPLFALADFDKIFRGEDNKEEIFTFANLKEENGITFAGNFIQPATIYVPTPETIAQFASDDKRASLSVASDGDETVLYKYISSSTTDPIIISRLSEMYLISAEGKGVSGGGLDRLNELRAFRGLANVKPAPTTDAQLLDAVLAERRLEFLGEGFRWYDLVRTGKYMEKTGLPEKYTVFPLPQRELDLNKNLIQNTLWQ